MRGLTSPAWRQYKYRHHVQYHHHVGFSHLVSHCSRALASVNDSVWNNSFPIHRNTQHYYEDRITTERHGEPALQIYL
jgi:hypothetical protein